MEQRLKESLSALLDGEADELELHRVLALSDEAELRALWARYHRVRTVMGSSDPRLHDFDISASVAAALTQGNAAPAVPVAVQKTASASVPVTASPTARFWKLGGLAASVAVAFVVGLNFQKSGTDAQSVPVNQVAATAAPVVRVQPVQRVEQLASARADAMPQYVSQFNADQQNADLQRRQPRLIERFSDADARRFNGYLLRHAEQTALSGRQGMAPFARVASFNAAGMSGSDFER